MNKPKFSTVLVIVVLLIMVMAVSNHLDEFWHGLFDTILPIGNTNK